MPTSPPAARPTLFYGWVVVAVVFVTLFFSLGLRFAFGVFYVAILDETGWTRADTAGVFSVAMAVYAAAAVGSGALFDWLGPRLLFPLGTAVLCLGLLLSAWIESIAGLYLCYGVLVGIGFAFLGFIPHMALVARWFVRRRGLASAVALSGIGTGSLGMVLLSEWLILSVGWRQAFVVFALGGAVVLIPLTALLHRTDPAHLGLHPDGDPEARPTAPHAGERAATLRGALRTPAFWMLFLAISLYGGSSNTLAVHQTRLSLDYGFSLAVAATLFGFTGLFRTLGTLTFGPLSDRIGHRACVFVACGMGVAAIAVLLVTRDLPVVPLLAAFALLWGIGFNGVTPVYASIVGDWFHGPHLGKVFGLLDLGFGMASALGPWLMGLLFDRTGSYHLPLQAMLAATAGTGLLLWLAARPRPGHRLAPDGPDPRR